MEFLTPAPSSLVPRPENVVEQHLRGVHTWEWRADHRVVFQVANGHHLGLEYTLLCRMAVDCGPMDCGTWMCGVSGLESGKVAEISTI